MATSTVYLAPMETCTWANGPTILENLRMSSGNKNKLAEHRQSTTLFPMRIQKNNSFSPSSNSDPQLNKPVNNSENEIHNFKITAAPDVVEGNSSLLTSNGEKNKRKLSLGRIPQYAKCFTCERIIKEDHFSEHLLFGPAKCLDCNACYNDCQSFQLWSVERSVGCVSCSHSINFSYCNDPVKYLIENLSKSENNIKKGKIPSKINDFIKKCTSLSDKLPWKQGIDACNDYLKYKHMPSSSLPKGEPSNSNLDKFGIVKRKEVNGFYTSHNEESTRATNQLEDESLGVILSQDFNLKQLEEATEFVEIRENTFHKETHNEKAKKKQANNRKRKQQQDTDKSDDESLEYLPVPSNGFYYVSTKSIEECPNCNEVLCPSNFTVNVTTFLITTVCTGCNLTIYITSPEVQILTNNDKDSWPTNNSKDEHKKKRGRPSKRSL